MRYQSVCYDNTSCNLQITCMDGMLTLRLSRSFSVLVARMLACCCMLFNHLNGNFGSRICCLPAAGVHPCDFCSMCCPRCSKSLIHNDAASSSQQIPLSLLLSGLLCDW